MLVRLRPSGTTAGQGHEGKLDTDFAIDYLLLTIFYWFFRPRTLMDFKDLLYLVGTILTLDLEGVGVALGGWWAFGDRWARRKFWAAGGLFVYSCGVSCRW